jgi:hypothetical protein
MCATALAATGFGSPSALPWLDGTPQIGFTAGAPGEAIVSGRIHDAPEIAVLRPGADDAPPQQLSTSAYVGPVVAANRSGQAIAAWGSVDEYRYQQPLQIASRAPGGEFGDTVTLDVAVSSAGPLDAAINSRGDVVVLYSSASPTGTFSLHAVFRRAGEHFTAPVDVDPGGTVGAWAMDVALDESGTATVAWFDTDQSDHRLHVTSGDGAAGFGPIRTFDSEPQRWTPPQLGVDADGGTALVWDAQVGTDHVDLMVARKPPGGQFSEPVTIGSSGTGSGFQLGVTRDGHMLVMWVGSIPGDGYFDSMSYTRVVLGSTRGGSFERYFDGSPNLDLVLPAMYVEPGGDVSFVNLPQPGYDDSPGHTMLVTNGSVAGGFGETHELGCPTAPPGYSGGLLTWGPDEMALLLPDMPPGTDEIRYSLVRTVIGTPPGPEFCAPSKPRVPGPLSVAVSAPRTVRPAALKRLPVSVSSKGSGRVTVSGRVSLRGGKRLGSFKTVRYGTRGSRHRRLRLTLAGRAAWLERVRRRGALARVTVTFTRKGGGTRTRVARIRVRGRS